MSYFEILKEYDFIENKKEFWRKLISPKKTFFRINTLKADKDQVVRALKNYQDMEFEEIGFLENFFVLNKGSISAKPEHIFGYIFIQDLASGLVIDSMKLQENFLTVDLCASAGGKTTLLASFYPSALIIANDLGNDRISALVHNVQRMGALNCVVTQCDARFFPCIENKDINLILADVPCSAEANLDNYESYNLKKHQNFIEYVTSLQYGILNRAVQISSKNTKIIYSTCTFNPLENELLLDKFIKEKKIKILPIRRLSEWKGFLENINPGIIKYKDYTFDESLKNTVRVYPSYHKGMFISNILPVNEYLNERESYGYKVNSKMEIVDIDKGINFQGYKLKRFDVEKVYEILKIFGIPFEVLEKLTWFYKDKGDKIEEIYVSSVGSFPVKKKGPLKVEYLGLKALKFYKPLKTYKPTSSFLTLLNRYIKGNYVELEFKVEVLKKFLRREAIGKEDLTDVKLEGDYPFVAVKYNGLVIGCAVRKFNNPLEFYSEIPTSKANFLLNLIE